MFEYIKGVLKEKYVRNNAYYLVLEQNGTGYKIEISETDYNSAPEPECEIKVYLKLIHKEDIMFLCGFLRRETREIFDYLLLVSGLGVKMALSLLGRFDACELISIVINEDYKELTLAKGVGTKLAQKIILELRDKLIKADLPVDAANYLSSNENNTPAFNETTSVLLSLGYTEEEIKTAYKIVSGKCADKNNPEELLRETLKYLSM